MAENKFSFFAYGDGEIYFNPYNFRNDKLIQYDKCLPLNDGDNISMQINLQTKQIYIIHNDEIIECGIIF